MYKDAPFSLFIYQLIGIQTASISWPLEWSITFLALAKISSTMLSKKRLSEHPFLALSFHRYAFSLVLGVDLFHSVFIVLCHSSCTLLSAGRLWWIHLGFCHRPFLCLLKKSEDFCLLVYLSWIMLVSWSNMIKN